jgi:hypothetical protein
MLGYRKHSFARAHALLQTLRANLADLATLKALQQLLIHEVIRAEKKIRELKAELRTINKRTTDSAAAKRLAYLENRIEGFRQCAYIWRCFGDAIAFLYMDKFALKHSFFSTEKLSVKQSAGFIGDKEGLVNELAVIDFLLEHNIPALLADLTNTIRHGDICVMVGPDPHLIEVKSSKNLDSRGKKQKRILEKLWAFYETDKAEGFRGFPEVSREVIERRERTYVEQINECIVEARKAGYAVRQPERGLHYIVMTQDAPDIKQIMGSLALKAPWCFFLNQAKSDRAWAPYLPFMLSIEDKDDLWDFIRGNLFIFVFVEVDRLCEIGRDKGYEATFDLDDESYPLRFVVPGGDGFTRASKQILGRIGMEFVSPEWVVLSGIEMFEQRVEAIKAEQSDAPVA